MKRLIATIIIGLAFLLTGCIPQSVYVMPLKNGKASVQHSIFITPVMQQMATNQGRVVEPPDGYKQRTLEGGLIQWYCNLENVEVPTSNEKVRNSYLFKIDNNPVFGVTYISYDPKLNTKDGLAVVVLSTGERSTDNDDLAPMFEGFSLYVVIDLRHIKGKIRANPMAVAGQKIVPTIEKRKITWEIPMSLYIRDPCTLTAVAFWK